MGHNDSFQGGPWTGAGLFPGAGVEAEVISGILAANTVYSEVKTTPPGTKCLKRVHKRVIYTVTALNRER